MNANAHGNHHGGVDKATRLDRRDRWAYVGILAVAIAAAVLSFDALTGLAGLAGVTGDPGGFRLAWLLPIAVDAYAVTSTRVWLRSAVTPATVAYARRNAVGAITLSVAGNAAFHGLTAAGIDRPRLAASGYGWLLVVAVSAVPPVMLGLVAHLHALVSGEHRTTPAPDAQANGHGDPSRGSASEAMTGRNPAAESAESAESDRRRPARTTPRSRGAARPAGSAADLLADRVQAARELIAAGELDERPSAEAIRKRLGGSAAIARAVRDSLTSTAGPATALVLAESNDNDDSRLRLAR